MNAAAATTERTDAELTEAWSAGEDRAFDLLYLRYAGRVTAFATRMLGRREEAEEVCTDTFARLVERRWRPVGSVRSWLFTVAHRACLDRLRRRQSAERWLAWFGRGAAASTSPEDLLLSGERERRLAAAIDGLSVDHRAVVLLAAVQELPSREVGEILSLDEQQVRSQLSYARKLLRARLNEEAP